MSSVLLYCPHCDTHVAERTYRRHKEVYFNTCTGTWDTDENYDIEEPVIKKPRDELINLQKNPEEEKSTSNVDDPSDTIDRLITEDPQTDVECIKLDPVSAFLNENVEEVWEDVTEDDVNQDLSAKNDSNCNGNKNNSQQQQFYLLTIARWTILFISSWSIHYNIPSVAIGYLLKFIHGFILACSHVLPDLRILLKLVPKTLHLLRKSQGNLEDDFIKYVVCPTCDSVYDLSKSPNITQCTYVKYPDHPQKKFREKCGTHLFKEVTLQNGIRKKYPIKSFCYRPIKDSLRSFLDRAGFQSLCNSWRNRENIPGTLRDIYDGKVWKSFMNYKGRPFLELPRHYGLQLNIDWFQPYKHSPYSIGGIYFSLMNLPRNLRNKEENIIVAGVIPGPHEPSITINSFLKPIVDELVDLWENGFRYKGIDDNEENEYYVALICCSCDVPATRKVCGFLGHMAKVGCSKCKKNFKTGRFGEKMNYGGFQNMYELRRDDEHRAIAYDIVEQTTRSAREKLENQHGVRYTELMRLVYFDCIRFPVIDPMHNLFQGTSKYLMKTVWVNKISPDSLREIQSLIDNMSVPTSLGRIPRKIQSSFSSFTSDQWKNWTLYFSAIVLKNHLPKEDFKCWLIFVEACRLLCTPTVTILQLKKGHEKLMGFCRAFEQLYGTDAVTPNMHLHTHLVDCILDYGPFHGFWLFGFERMNGILGSFNTNKRSPEIQYMRRICQTQDIQRLPKPVDLTDYFLPSFDFDDNKDSEEQNSTMAQNLLSLSQGIVRRDIIWLQDVTVMYYGTRIDACMTEHYLDFLKTAVSKILEIDQNIVSGCCNKYYSMEMCGEKFGSSNSRLSRSSVILGSWCGREGDINDTGKDMRPGIVRFFITFYIADHGKQKPVHFAFVHWFQKVAYNFCPLVSLWARNLFEPEGPACFLPVQRIAGKAICAPVKVNNEHVLAVIPHLRHLFY